MAADLEETARGEIVFGVPYIGEALSDWQSFMKFRRAFAPPVVSGGYVTSDAEVEGNDQDRWQVEVAWIAPISTSWDLNVRETIQWFGADDRPKDLFEVDLTFYTDETNQSGVRMSFEEGFRAALGDIGSTVLFGYVTGF